MKNFKKKQDGFTLLELLVVVAILATIGGAVVGTFGNQEQNAAQGTATNTIAALENSLRVYEATQGELPKDLESLACRPYDDSTGQGTLTPTVVNTATPTLAATGEAYKLGGSSNLNGVGGGLGLKLAGKFDLLSVNADGLIDGGISSVRYAAASACDETAGATAMNFGNATGVVSIVDGNLSDISIPNHMFESPRTGGTKNRGRGFSQPLVLGTPEPLMVWKRGAGGYNNVKIGAEENDVLVGLGIGQASSMVGTNSEAMLGKAPFYGQIARDKYAHYIAIIKIGTATLDATSGLPTVGFAKSTARVVAIVDARGDFLDEEIAEFTDQKQ